MYNRLIRLVGYDYPSFGWSRRLGRDRFQLEETGETNRSSLRYSSGLSQHGSPLSHLNNNLLHSLDRLSRFRLVRRSFRRSSDRLAVCQRTGSLIDTGVRGMLVPGRSTEDPAIEALHGTHSSVSK